MNDLIDETAEEVYDGAPCGFLTTRPDGAIVRVNQKFLDWTGYTRDAVLLGRRFQDLLSVAGRVYHETHLAPLLRMQGFVNEVALDLVGADGREVPVLVNIVQKRDEAGRPLLHRTTLFNATDRRRYERELLAARRAAEQAARARADLLAMIGHDIRTPLAAVVNATGLLERTATPKQEQYLRLLRSSTSQLLRLTGSLLDLSKLEAGVVTLDPQPFDVRQFLEDVVEALAPVAAAKGIALETTLDATLPGRLVGDVVKLGQAVTNLVTNAIKFTESGAVTITIQAAEWLSGAVAVRVSVADTGIGIAPDRLAWIFEDFTQASPETAARYGGTGLGLAITRRLLELHGSTIAVYSEPAKGSTFVFVVTLPIPGD